MSEEEISEKLMNAKNNKGSDTSGKLINRKGSIAGIKLTPLDKNLQQIVEKPQNTKNMPNPFAKFERKSEPNINENLMNSPKVLAATFGKKRSIKRQKSNLNDNSDASI